MLIIHAKYLRYCLILMLITQMLFAFNSSGDINYLSGIFKINGLGTFKFWIKLMILMLQILTIYGLVFTKVIARIAFINILIIGVFLFYQIKDNTLLQVFNRFDFWHSCLLITVFFSFAYPNGIRKFILYSPEFSFRKEDMMR